MHAHESQDTPVSNVTQCTPHVFNTTNQKYEDAVGLVLLATQCGISNVMLSCEQQHEASPQRKNLNPTLNPRLLSRPSPRTPRRP
jgi:peptide deformylase